MRFMIIVKATKESEAGVMPEDSLVGKMVTFHEALAKAGMLVEGSGLQPSSKGQRVQYEGDKTTFMDGPFTETKELIAGFTIIKAESREQAIEWTKRFPNPAGDGKPAQIEVRQFFELEDFEPGEAIDRFRELEAELSQQ